MRKLLVLVLLLIGTEQLFCQSKVVDPLKEAFVNPPESTKPWVFWYWVSSNISKEGITKDLEAMAKVGIGEALISNVNDPSVAVGKIPVLTEEWWSCIEHAIREAGRLGIKVGMFNCPGWSQSGGPWIKPENAMRYLISSETRVKGLQLFQQKLKAPKDTFQQMAVQAFKVPKGEGISVNNLPHRVTKSENLNEAQNLFDGDRSTIGAFSSFPATIEINLDQPLTIRSLRIFPVDLAMSAFCELQYKDQMGAWKTITKPKIDRENLALAVGFVPFAPFVESFPSVTSQNFRMIFTPAERFDVWIPVNDCPGRISELELTSAALLSHVSEKQLAKMCPNPYIKWDSYLWNAPAEPETSDFSIAEKEIVDLTSKVDSNGVLTWEVPAGEWIILRTGLTPTGTKNAPVTPEAEGLEVDKMSKLYTQKHFDAYIGKLLNRIPAKDRKGLRHIVVDSYEVGGQNGTDSLSHLFRKTYGYDPAPYFPVLTGRIVESADKSERFLWDLRRLVADRMATEYIGGLRERCESNGLRLWIENYGGWGFPGDFLKYGGASHDIGGEFWVDNPKLGAIECRCASSAAHIYGKNIVSAESFTANNSFNLMPRDLKLRGDWSMTEGVNHFVMHLYIHQPYERVPGMSAWFGTDFNRHSTWFFPAISYFEYIRRSTALLQQGRPVADVAYFVGEDAPKMTGDKNPKLPSGYDYDYLNADVLMQATVKDGRILLASGANYSILVLSDQKTMRPELLRKLADLVANGATILGPKPDKSPSLRGYPGCDREVQTIASKLWGKIDGVSVTENSVGAGRVFSGIGLDASFRRMKIMPDMVLPDGFLYTHRNSSSSEIYFLTNQKPGSQKATFAFRVSGKQPELWDAVSGEMRPLPQYEEKNGMTYIQLEFGDAASCFIVFGKKPVAGQKGENYPAKREVQTLSGSWKVSFNTKLEAPANVTFDTLTDWTKNSDESIKYYSGKAVYSKTFIHKEEVSKKYYIDLGQVEKMAVVRLNGKNIGTLWCYPYCINLSNALIQGENRLEIDLINPWWNRLVRDKNSNVKHFTWASWDLGWKEKSPLQPSGLMGPVRILTEN